MDSMFNRLAELWQEHKQKRVEECRRLEDEQRRREEESRKREEERLRNEEACRLREEAERERKYGSNKLKHVRHNLQVAFWCESHEHRYKVIDIPGYDGYTSKPVRYYKTIVPDTTPIAAADSQTYHVCVKPADNVPETDIYVGLHWMHESNAYGGWICDKRPTYIGQGCFQVDYSLKEIVKGRVPRNTSFRLSPVVYYTPDGTFDHATFNTTLEDAANAGLFVMPSVDLIDKVRVELSRSTDVGMGHRLARAVRPTVVSKPDAEVVSKDSFICIDGNNVIGVNDRLRTRTLKAVVTALKSAGYRYRVFVDHSVFGWLKREHDVAGLDYLRQGEADGSIHVVSAGTPADDPILQIAEFEMDVHIIKGSEHYRDYEAKHSWLKSRGFTAKRLHGVEVIPMAEHRFRITIAGFKLDIMVQL